MLFTRIRSTLLKKCNCILKAKQKECGKYGLKLLGNVECDMFSNLIIAFRILMKSTLNEIFRK